jgi:uncharacterized membrane protein YhaH (DUF805 family)
MQGNPNDDVFLVVILIFVGVFVLIALAIQIFFLLTLSRLLQRVHPRNRLMEPGQVWLNLIPCFNLVWRFITVNRIHESLRSEFYDLREEERGEDYGKQIGTAWLILELCGFIPYIGTLFSIAGLVCFILYWVKMHGYSQKLKMLGADEIEEMEADRNRDPE